MSDLRLTPSDDCWSAMTAGAGSEVGSEVDSPPNAHRSHNVVQQRLMSVGYLDLAPQIIYAKPEAITICSD